MVIRSFFAGSLYSTAFGMWRLRIVGGWISVGSALCMRSLFPVHRFNKNISLRKQPSRCTRKNKSGPPFEQNGGPDLFCSHIEHGIAQFIDENSCG
jgi:hypothetical protein